MICRLQQPHAIGVASPILTSYAGHRYFTFAAKRDG